MNVTESPSLTEFELAETVNVGFVAEVPRKVDPVPEGTEGVTTKAAVLARPTEYAALFEDNETVTVSSLSLADPLYPRSNCH
ncbi:unannotated protein [freshwater metagenome]|uniref:Unannotated protein n=1 Tax=freshwater metagenome TaxID=449393 RepID=A0A6J7TMN1_9ZZZZ